ncbi:hypothetical protein AOLI_G00117510 [Acnodon oligacanthus]
MEIAYAGEVSPGLNISAGRPAQCKTARYCSVQCQKEAWPEHKSECPCLKRVHPRIPTDSVRLTARIIFRLLSDPAADGEELYSIAEHQPHLEDMSDEQREGLTHLCSTLKLYLGQENADPSLPNGLTPIGLLARSGFSARSLKKRVLRLFRP